MAVDVLPRGSEARERALVDRLDLLAQHRERSAAQPAEHLGVTPLALAPARSELAAYELAVALELLQHCARIQSVARPHIVGRERSMGRRVAPQQPGERAGHVLEECFGK